MRITFPLAFSASVHGPVGAVVVERRVALLAVQPPVTNFQQGITDSTASPQSLAPGLPTRQRVRFPLIGERFQWYHDAHQDVQQQDGPASR